MNKMLSIALMSLLCGSCGRSDDVIVEYPEVKLGKYTRINYPLHKSITDTQTIFALNADLPFSIEIGRGSGWHGLDILTLNNTGAVVIRRVKSNTNRVYECADMKLTIKDILDIANCVNDCGILKLDRMYSADVRDGTQCVFVLKQGNNEKFVYFNNHFPPAFQIFTTTIDNILNNNGFSKLTWSPSSDTHEKGLWEGIRLQLSGSDKK
jgi:hypothetical protein